MFFFPDAMFLLGLPGKFICSLKFNNNFLVGSGKSFLLFLVCRCFSFSQVFHFQVRFQPFVLHTYHTYPLPPGTRKEMGNSQVAGRNPQCSTHSNHHLPPACLPVMKVSAVTSHPENQSTSTEHVVVTNRK